MCGLTHVEWILLSGPPKEKLCPWGKGKESLPKNGYSFLPKEGLFVGVEYTLYFLSGTP